jgi:hypothetical protein
MFTPQPAVFVDRVMRWIAQRRPATLPAHMLATHTRASVDAVQCIRTRAGKTATTTTPATTNPTEIEKTSTTKSTTKSTPTTAIGKHDCAPNPSRVADTFDTFRDIVLAMNVFGEKYREELLATTHAPVLGPEPDL